jgi:hypothetical protein
MNVTHENTISMNVTSSALICLAWIFNYIAEFFVHLQWRPDFFIQMPWNLIYEVTFKMLSLVSVTMVISINWQKFKDNYKRGKKKKNP